MSLVVLIIGVVSFLYFLPSIANFVKQISRHLKYGKLIPGPKAYPVIGNALHIPKIIHEWTPFFNNNGNKYLREGSELMRFWIGWRLVVVPLNGKCTKQILDSIEEITKGQEYDIIEPWLGTGLLISTNEKWRSRRKMLTPTFHFTMLDGYVTVFDKQAKFLVDILAEFCEKNEKVDLFPYVKRCALDIICETAMGTHLNAQVNHKHPYVIAVGEMGKLSTVYALRPELWFAPIWYLLGYGFKYNRVLKTLTDFTKEVIANRQKYFQPDEDKKGRKAFLDMLLDMKSSNNLSDEDIREEVDTFMFEGHDTTSSGMSWSLWCLACHPEIQKKAVEEQFDIFGETDRECTVEDIKSMSYLERCIKEAMRMRPPVPYITRTLKNDLTMGGFVVPSGANIVISPNVVHHNEQVWKEAEVFDPDRFLPENLSQRHPYDYIPFSAGPRNCIGQKFATYEEKVVVSWMLRKYEISTNQDFLSNLQSPEMILRPVDGIQVFLKKRKF